jgi:hypothetical protein
METSSMYDQITALIESNDAIYTDILEIESELGCDLIKDRYDHATDKGNVIISRNGDVVKVQYSGLHNCYVIDNVIELI